MSTQRILIVFGTSYGQTAKIAQRMRAVLAENGFGAAVYDADDESADMNPYAFDGILVGGSLIRGGHQRSVRRFVSRHLLRINTMPSGFFSVSASAASREPRGQADARDAMQRFLTETHWEPDMMTTLAGAITFTKYSFVTRWIMKRISRLNGGPTDTSRDHELTDWTHVDEFARRFGRLVAGSKPVELPAGSAH